MATTTALALPNLYDAAETYDQNLASVERARAAATELLALDPATLTPEQDAQLETYLVKARRTLEQLQERRQPLTRALDGIRAQFVALEAQLDPKKKDSLPARLQALRDAYATRVRAEQQALADQAREAARQAAALEAADAPLPEQLAAVQQAALLASVPTPEVPRGREGVRVEITHPRAYLALLALFLEREERTVDQLSRLTLGQLATFAERLALSSGELLDVEGLSYVSTFKTVAR